MFVPEGLQRTLRARCARPTGRSTTRHHVFKDYAHLDLWLGENAERDVWPTALAELERQLVSTTADDRPHDRTPPGCATSSATR